MISTLNKLLRQYIAGWWKSERPINQLRCEILRVCIDGGEQDPGLFTLTAPTGSGKTISSLAFALNHAAVHGKDRIIYVIPYVSIIEQTAQKFAEIFGEGQVVAHYAAADPDSTDDDVTPAMQRNQLAAENWDAPIIVTTFDARSIAV
ncbi:MAG: DEAD/DEAH box helicase [Oscillospiraceae bacterium]